MKQVIHNTIVVLLTLVVVGTANAIPRLQTFINGSKYVRGYDGRFDGTWMTHNASFRLDVIGAWHSGPRVGWRPNHRSMDTYLVIGVPQGETGEVWVDGTRLSSVANDFDNVRPAGFAGRLGRVQPSAHGALDLRFYHLGQIDNEERKVVDCAPLGASGELFWGDMFAVDVSLTGFSYAKFGAAGIDEYGFSHINPYSRDSAFSEVAGTPTPEPGTLGLLGMGLLGLIPFRKKQKKIG